MLGLMYLILSIRYWVFVFDIGYYLLDIRFSVKIVIRSEATFGPLGIIGKFYLSYQKDQGLLLLMRH